VILGLVYLRKKRLSDHAFVLLLTAALSTMVYEMVLYPFFWAFDWDLFSQAGFCCTVLAGYLLLSGIDSRRVRMYLLVYLISFTLFFATIPFILIGAMREIHDAGFFSHNNPPTEKVVVFDPYKSLKPSP
jgi:uncharacterized membrane protein